MHNGVAPTTAAGASGATASEAATAPPPAGVGTPMRCFNTSCSSHRSGDNPSLLRAGVYASAIYFCGDADKLCHTCTVQCGNITKDGHVAATAALTPEVRAKLGGVEYLFAELAPRLEAPELQPFLVALAQHVVSWPVESVMRTRPWSHADDYSAHDTRAALETVTAALRVA
mmetsp:Transcript_7857/g.20372  ORF Transcript_7857/g.20372 Transcript_7857/m.20372 type:complete len:172 (-) Transcript_7857:278-793(-)